MSVDGGANRSMLTEASRREIAVDERFELGHLVRTILLVGAIAAALVARAFFS